MKHNRIISTLFSIVLLINCFSLGQDVVSISGFVRSDIDLKPIPYGIVHIKDIGLVVYINNAGWYKLEKVPKGRYIISTRVDGYFTKDTAITTDSLTSFALNFVLKSKCSINAAHAERDIRAGKPRLIHITGIISADYSLQDRHFEGAYGVKYFGFGCTAPPDNCIIEYNTVIFKYLDDKFGTQWRNDVRKDVLGLERM